MNEATPLTPSEIAELGVRQEPKVRALFERRVRVTIESLKAERDHARQRADELPAKDTNPSDEAKPLPSWKPTCNVCRDTGKILKAISQDKPPVYGPCPECARGKVETLRVECDALKAERDALLAERDATATAQGAHEAVADSRLFYLDKFADALHAALPVLRTSIEAARLMGDKPERDPRSWRSYHKALARWREAARTWEGESK